MSPRLTIDRERISEFCRQHHIRRLALFGSVLRADFGPSSDVDVLVEFEPDHVPGLAFFTMQQELSTLIGRPVDLNTPGFLSRYFRETVLNEAEPLYVAA
ncbi:MAG: nucleotidyltransferase family protein [candidate division WOR-3 bacterium]|nr:nucleotidyltransferase family protein [candidate division WOR-3 bacterium]